VIRSQLTFVSFPSPGEGLRERQSRTSEDQTHRDDETIDRAVIRIIARLTNSVLEMVDAASGCCALCLTPMVRPSSPRGLLSEGDGQSCGKDRNRGDDAKVCQVIFSG
jgi:hypothetical protein